jgi:hypothetical protein
MAKVILKVSYRVAAHRAADFERALLGEVLPLARELGIEPHGIWKTFVGNVGEYLELWRFGSIGEFERKWRQLLAHPQLQEVFARTGPMVREETFALMEPLAPNPGTSDAASSHLV